jgi:hypothetical protein
MKTRLRWFWVALGALLAVLGEVFLRKLLAVFLCGAFLLNYCLPLAQFGGAAVAQTSQPGVLQSQTGQKIDDYFNPIHQDGQPRLGIDRWWATAGVDKEIAISWTIEVKKIGNYSLYLPLQEARFSKWKLGSNAMVTILNSSNQPIRSVNFPFMPPSSKVDIGPLEAGIYTLQIQNFIVPQEATVEEVKFQLGLIPPNSGTASKFNPIDEFSALFVADHDEASSSQRYSVKVKEKRLDLEKNNIFKELIAKKQLTKNELINYFAPVLNFEPKDEAQFPLNVNQTTWTQSPDNQLLQRGDAKGLLNLTRFKDKKHETTKLPSKIYASIIEKRWKDKESNATVGELAINYYFHYSQSNWKDHGGFNNHQGDWEGITLFLRRDQDGYYYPCRFAFGQHVNFQGVSSSPLSPWGDRIKTQKGGQVFPWADLKFMHANDRYNPIAVAQNPTQSQIFQPMIYVGLGGHGSYPSGTSTNFEIQHPDQVGSTKYLTGIEFHRGGNASNLRGNVEYLPRVGQGFKADAMIGKEWLLYPGTWGDPKQCDAAVVIGASFFCPNAPRGPVFQDLKLVISGEKNDGLAQRWLDPWEWSSNFQGADKIIDCPPPKEELQPEPSPEVFQKPDGSTGSVFGDPHIVTLDGLRNSFQAAGEFILARSVDGNFEVQTRFAPVGKNASLTTAVAVKIGSDRIGIYPGNLLRINGQRSILAEGSVLSLRGGGRLLRQGNNFTISAPTQEFLQVSGGSTLTVNLTVPKNRRGTIRGLLGNNNGKAEDDLQTRDGKSLPMNPSYDQLYNVFGKSWRVSQDESLFDYGAGETAATFALLDFPQKVLTLADFSAQQKQEAEKVCRSAGVSNAALLESCLFDVLVTGDRSFANISAYVQSKVKVTANVTPLVEQSKPTSSAEKETAKPSSNRLISSVTNINYSRLRDLLEVKNWSEADDETWSLIYAGLRKLYPPTSPSSGLFSPGGVNAFRSILCEDLRIIDQLWESASGGKYGFSAQKEIWKKWGSPTFNDKSFSFREDNEGRWRWSYFVWALKGMVGRPPRDSWDDSRVIYPGAGDTLGYYYILSGNCF